MTQGCSHTSESMVDGIFRGSVSGAGDCKSEFFNFDDARRFARALATHAGLHLEGVAVHAPVRAAFGPQRKVVGGVEGRGLGDFEDRLGHWVNARRCTCGSGR